MLDADFIVAGGGVAGLQTALELRARRPHDRIMVLERGLVPAGASSRNAGFACSGSLTKLLSDFDFMGENAVLATVERRWRGLARLRRRLGDATIGYENCGGFELLLDAHISALDRLDEVNDKLRPLFGQPVFSCDAGALHSSRFGPQVKALIRNPLEGQLHPGRLMCALARLAAAQEIEIHTGMQVQTLEENGDMVLAYAAGASAIAFRAASIISTAVFIIFATSTSACCWAAGAISILRRKPRLKQR
jgi:glycine/D-amino acid oxidase-like deaminating enzyme